MMKNTSNHPILTIGYEGTTPEALIEALLAHRVKRLIDVRAVPMSRKRGFSKTKLAEALVAAGIEYVHLRALGTPKAGREAVRGNNIAEFESIFTAHMEEPEALLALAQAEELVAEQPSCLLCFEHAPSHCHRSIIAGMIAERSGQAIVAL